MTATPKQRRAAYRVVPLVLVALVLLAFHGPILARIGRYMAPTTTDSADVVVLAGNSLIDKGGLHEGVVLLSQGRANRMVVVLLYPLEAGPDSALERECGRLIAYESHRLDVKEERSSVLSVPIGGHPITRSEARFVTDKLHDDGVRSAILLADGFHTRRSIAAYRLEASRLSLNIVPRAHFTGYDGDSWWRTSKGIGDFVTEASKFLYYLTEGYLPVSSLWSLDLRGFTHNGPRHLLPQNPCVTGVAPTQEDS
jgi:uncharacterized SAM-binding protein YcdF (DUF218 family)